jgi:hypothetical protein
MRKTILLICGAFFLSVRAQKPPVHMKPPPPAGKTRPAPEISKEQLWAAEKLQKRFEQEVAAKYKGEVKSEVREGPFQTLLVRAYFPGAYPGTGVMSAIVDKTATSYGIHGERDFADFVRAQGWLKVEPDVDDFMRVLDYAQFEAVVMNMSHLEAPTLQNEGQGLVLRFVRGFMPNGAYPTEVIVAQTGGVKVIQKPDRGKGR